MELVKRSITGILYVAAIIAGIILGGEWMYWLFAICTVVTTIEFVSLINRYKESNASYICAAILSYFFYSGITGCLTGFSHTSTDNLLKLFIPFIVFLVLTIIRELYQLNRHHILNLSITIFPVIYIAMPFGLLNGMGYIMPSDVSVWLLPLSFFIFIWTNDVGAYCVGCTIGKHRLFERISPKKSWEGSIGGAIFTIIAAVAVWHFYPIFDVWIWIGMAITIVIFGTYGDLAESLLKRELGVKDSGNILPGHGGFLGRFDSTLLAAPMAFAYIYFLS